MVHLYFYIYVFHKDLKKKKKLDKLVNYVFTFLDSEITFKGGKEFICVNEVEIQEKLSQQLLAITQRT